MAPRTSDAALLHPVFLERWSSRSFTDEPVADDALAACFEAARWAASWMNNQPWHFVYATEGPDRDALLGVVDGFNRVWADRAPVVGLVVAATELTGDMARTRDFDTGAAMAQFAIQATMLGLAVHVMGGIDVAAAHRLIGLDPAAGAVLCGFVVGHRGEPDLLDDQLAAREVPSPRHPVEAFAHRGTRLP